MSYLPRLISPEEKELDVAELLHSRYWHRVKFNDIGTGDRVLVIRTTNGTRLLVESVVKEFKYEKGAWVNDLDTPIVSYLDTQIFRAGESPKSQSEVADDSVLGG